MKKNPIICLRTLFCLLLLFVSSFPNLLFAQLAGNYTINPNLPASATNYLTFTSAVSDLVSGTRSDGGSKNGPGVMAAVVFNVADGMYEEQLHIKRISGTSATNTITFQSISDDSSKVIIAKTDQTVDKPILTLDSVEFLFFKKLTFLRSYGVNNAGGNYVIYLKQKANNNQFLNNKISYTKFYGSSIDVIFYPAIFTQLSNSNIFKNNLIKYGESGIVFGSNYLDNSDTGNVIEGNIIDSCNFGITISNQKNARVSNNLLYVKYYGFIAFDSMTNVKVTHNYMTGSMALYGPKTNFMVANNFIVVTRLDGLFYGGKGVTKFYNNTINIQNSSSNLSTLTIDCHTINYDENDVFEIINNNITNLSSGSVFDFKCPKHLIYKGDNNNIFSTGSTLAIIDGVKIKNLHTFRQITKTDSNSISVNPAYVSSTDLHVRNPALNGKGKPLAEIKDDFDGEPRDPNFPDIGADEFTPVFSATDSVWPGDANYDRVANAWDVLNIGVAYNATGTSRSNASSNWTAQAATDWSKSFTNGLNYKHTDCNGDGKVDTSDLKPILLNYGKTHNKTSLNKTGTPNDPALYVQFPKDSFLAGDTVVADLYLGTNNISVSNGYGFAFTLNYNPKYVDSGSFTIDLSNSWFGKKDTDLIYFVKDHYINGQVDIGITRINQKNVSGFGKIGTCSFVLQENIAGKRWIDRTITLEPSDVKMISADETEIPVYIIGDSVKAHQFVGINDNRNNPVNEIKIYPNPVKDMLTIDAAGQTVKEIKILNMLGQVVFDNQVQDAQEKIIVSTARLPKGIYNVFITSAKGTSARRIVKY